MKFKIFFALAFLIFQTLIEHYNNHLSYQFLLHCVSLLKVDQSNDNR